jgi:hypothetical protein
MAATADTMRVSSRPGVMASSVIGVFLTRVGSAWVWAPGLARRFSAWGVWRQTERPDRLERQLVEVVAGAV